MNQRNQIKIRQKLSKIQNNNFGIDDVEILLINIREFARQEKFYLLLEFCDFVAHPDRNKGIIYEEFDILYSKFKYMPTQKGDELDYNNINKDVFSLLFIKGIDQLKDEFLIDNIGKNAAQLKDYITLKLVEKKGQVYSAINQQAVKELREIQAITNQPPQIRHLTENMLFDEIKKCVSNLSKTINFHYEETPFDRSKNRLIFCFLEIIQKCNINLHDGNKGEGFISVGNNNTKYFTDPKIENLNLSFSAQVPIQKSFVLFPLIQTWLFVGNFVSNPDSGIEWLNNEYTYGKLKPFTLEKN